MNVVSDIDWYMDTYYIVKRPNYNIFLLQKLNYIYTSLAWRSNTITTLFSVFSNQFMNLSIIWYQNNVNRSKELQYVWYYEFNTVFIVFPVQNNDFLTIFHHILAKNSKKSLLWRDCQYHMIIVNIEISITNFDVFFYLFMIF